MTLELTTLLRLHGTDVSDQAADEIIHLHIEVSRLNKGLRQVCEDNKRLQAEVARMETLLEQERDSHAKRYDQDGTRIAELEMGLPLLSQIDEYLDKHPYPVLDADIHWGVFHHRVKNHLAALLGEKPDA